MSAIFFSICACNHSTGPELYNEAKWVEQTFSSKKFMGFAPIIKVELHRARNLYQWNASGCAGGCTAMDVVALLKKYKQIPKSFNIDVDVEPSTGTQPTVFTKALISFVVEGPVDADKLVEAVHLSQTKYCGVSAMLAQAFPIEYRIILNGREIGVGAAKFSIYQKENM